MRHGGMGSVALAVGMLAGCAQLPGGPDNQAPLMTPVEAVDQANKWPREGVRGRFAFEVKAVGTNGEDTFVNSEPDYRDPRCLTLRMAPWLRKQLEVRLNGKLEQVLVGRRLLVHGIARRVRIDLLENGLTTGKFYYQTHVHIFKDEQIAVI